MDEIVKRGIVSVVDDVLRDVHSQTHVFLSVDVDVCDPAFAPGTGTPEPGGLQARELLRAVRRIAACGARKPCLDKGTPSRATEGGSDRAIRLRQPLTGAAVASAIAAARKR